MQLTAARVCKCEQKRLKRAGKLQICSVIPCNNSCEAHCTSRSSVSWRETNENKLNKVPETKIADRPKAADSEKISEVLQENERSKTTKDGESLDMTKSSFSFQGIEDLETLKEQTAHEPDDSDDVEALNNEPGDLEALDQEHDDAEVLDNGPDDVEAFDHEINNVEEVDHLQYFKANEPNNDDLESGKFLNEATAHYSNNEETLENQALADQADKNQKSSNANNTFLLDEGYETYKSISINELSVEGNKTHKSFNEVVAAADNIEDFNPNEAPETLNFEEEIYKAHPSVSDGLRSQTSIKSNELIKKHQVSRINDETVNNFQGKGSLLKFSYMNFHADSFS